MPYFGEAQIRKQLPAASGIDRKVLARGFEICFKFQEILYMKSLLVTLLLTAGFMSHAQDVSPTKITNGTRLYYTAQTPDQEVPLLITVDSAGKERIRMSWSIDGFGSGAWIMNKASIESANRGSWGEPSVGEDEVIADEETVLYFSKALWNSVKNEKKATYDNVNYVVKPAAAGDLLQVNGKAIDQIYLESENGASKIWLLNDPSFPLVLKISGNPAGIDLWITNIEH